MNRIRKRSGLIAAILMGVAALAAAGVLGAQFFNQSKRVSATISEPDYKIKAAYLFDSLDADNHAVGRVDLTDGFSAAESRWSGESKFFTIELEKNENHTLDGSSKLIIDLALPFEISVDKENLPVQMHFESNQPKTFTASVRPNKTQEFQVNGDGYYSGKTVFSIENGMEKATLTVAINFNRSLYVNGKAGYKISNAGTPSITVNSVTTAGGDEARQDKYYAGQAIATCFYKQAFRFRSKTSAEGDDEYVPSVGQAVNQFVYLKDDLYKDGDNNYRLIQKAVITFPAAENVIYNTDAVTSPMVPEGHCVVKNLPDGGVQIELTTDREGIYFKCGSDSLFGGLSVTSSKIQDVSVKPEIVLTDLFGNEYKKQYETLICHFQEAISDVKFATSFGGECYADGGEFVNYLGHWSIHNEGAADSNPVDVTMKFDTDNTGTIGVTTVFVPYPHIRNRVDLLLRYQLTGDTAYREKTLELHHVNASGYLLTREMLGASDGQYIKEIFYRIDSIRANERLYSNSNEETFNTGGSFSGYFFGGLEGSASCTCTIREEGKAEIPLTFSVKGTDHCNIRLGINPVEREHPYVVAGSANTLKFNLIVHMKLNRSSYHGNHVMAGCFNMDGFTMLLDIPEGLSVKEVKVDEIGGITIEEQPIASRHSGYQVWKITVPNGHPWGYLEEDGSRLNGKDVRAISVTFDTDPYMKETSVDLYDNLYIGREMCHQVGIQTTMIEDRYDLNGCNTLDNNRTDYVCGIDPQNAEAVMFTVGARKPELVFHDQFSIPSGSGAVLSDDGRIVTLCSSDDLIGYTIDIATKQSGILSNFMWYIDIPNREQEGNVTTGLLSEFYLSLNGAATVSHPEQFAPEYTVDRFSYDNVDSCVWLGADEISDWARVNAIRIRQKSGAELGLNPSDDPIRIGLTYQYKQDQPQSYEYYAGCGNVWYLAGSYQLRNNTGTISSAGFFSINEENPVAVLVSYEKQLEFVLTAAPQDDPGAVREAQEQFSRSVFFKEQNFSIPERGVDVEGLRLQDASVYTDEYIRTAGGGVANTWFGLQIGLTADGLKDVKGNAEVGALPAETQPMLNLRLWNADSLIKTGVVGTVRVELKSDHGITLKLRIQINSIAMTVSNPELAIIAGEVFNNVPKHNNPTISPRSAMTAQFVYDNYIPDQYGEHSLILGRGSFPSRTRIIMVDWSGSKPEYYFHECDGESTIALSEFRRMGNREERYVEKEGNSSVSENFVFVIDFSNCTELTGLIAEGENTLRLKVEKSPDADATVQELDATLNFTIGTRSEFSISVDGTMRVGRSKTVTYGYTQSSGYEKLFVGRQAELVLSSDGFPVDLYAEYDRNRYDQYSDETIVIPLGAVSQMSRSGTLAMFTKENFSEPITVKASLWVVNEKNHGNVNHGRSGVLVAEQEILLVCSDSLSVKVTDARGDVSNTGRILTGSDSKLTLSYVTQNFTAVSASVRILDERGNEGISGSGSFMTGYTGNDGSVVINLGQTLKQTPGLYHVELTVTDADGSFVRIRYYFIMQ